ncbi:hypothetical protein R1flu_027438 [Riccia fluitans]|uniref:Secreted protein n=1 Tax=Riccia fluitans TaxID=41844 RepID=A0ABD1XIW9_9MARC
MSTVQNTTPQSSSAFFRFAILICAWRSRVCVTTTPGLFGSSFPAGSPLRCPVCPHHSLVLFAEACLPMALGSVKRVLVIARASDLSAEPVSPLPETLNGRLERQHLVKPGVWVERTRLYYCVVA